MKFKRFTKPKFLKQVGRELQTPLVERRQTDGLPGNGGVNPVRE